MAGAAGARQRGAEEASPDRARARHQRSAPFPGSGENNLCRLCCGRAQVEERYMKTIIPIQEGSGVVHQSPLLLCCC